MARLIVATVAAAAVAYVTRSPTATLQTFALVYGVTGFLDPKQHVLGPRLLDLKAPQADFGAPLAYIEGAPRLAGCVIYASSKREIATTQDQSGKGGPGVSSTTYTYEIDLLVALSDNPLAGVRRIWSNGKLVWTIGDDADAASLAATGGAFVDAGGSFVEGGSNGNWRALRFYGGGPDQLPDPTYEAAVGIGNAPAFRGRATLMLEGLNLGNSGQLPVLTFEVLSESTQQILLSTMADAPAVAPFANGCPAFSNDGFILPIGQWDTSYTNPQVIAYFVDTDGSVGIDHVFDIEPGFIGPCALGNSDESCIVPFSQGDPSAGGMFYDGDGDGVPLAAGENLGTNQVRFSKVGSTIVIGSISTGSKKLYQFDRDTGGSPTLSSAAMSQYVQSIAIGGAFVYALAADSSVIYQIDLLTMTLQASIAPPIFASAENAIVCDETGGLAYIYGGLGGQFYRYDGTAWGTALAVNAAIAADNTNSHYSFAEGTVWSARPVSGGVEFEISRAQTTLAINTPALDQVVRRLCLRTGLLTDADIDVTQLAGQTMRAMAISQVSTTRTALETLMAAYLFEATESQKLVFVPRGGSPVLTIPYADLGASPDGTAEQLPKKRLADAEVPAFVTITYANVLNDFQSGSESADRLVTGSTAESVVEIALGLTPTEAKRIADVNTMDLAVGMLQIGPIALRTQYAALEPTDVVLLTAADGSTFRSRIGANTVGAGLIAPTLVLDDASVITSVAETDTTYTGSTLIRALAPTDLVLLDIPILRDVDNTPGFYAAFGATGSWPGAELDVSPDDVTYTKVLDATSRGVLGSAAGALGDFERGNRFDERNTLTVNVGDGTLASATRAALLASSTLNAMAIGAEVVQFRSASLLSSGPNVYLLSGFLRGRRGTESQIGAHGPSERVVLLQTSGIRRVTDQQADVGAVRDWKAVTYGQTKARAKTKVFTDTGIGQKPFAPVDLRVDDSSGQAVLEWHRRSRLSSRFLATSGDPPLGELAESYDVVLTDSFDTVVASATVNTNSYAVSSFKPGDYILPPIWGMATISGERVAGRDDAPSATFNPFNFQSLLSLNSDGTVHLQSPNLGNRVLQWCNNGDSLYAVTVDYTNSTPAFYANGKLYKLTRTTLGSVDATVTAGTAGDFQGVAHDGTNLWVAERATGKLSKRDPTTLSESVAYSITGGPTMLLYASSKLYVLCSDSDELVRWDIATQTEDFRVATSHVPSDMLLSGGKVFVLGTSAQVFNATTGAAVATYPYAPPQLLPQRGLCLFGSYVAIAVGNPTPARVLRLDAGTGLYHDLILAPVPTLWFPAGSDGSAPDLYLTGSAASGSSVRTRKYEVAPPGLAGYTLTVWQNSAAVGRGYPATLEL